ncbi:MAG: 2-phospho-L-lactate transferase [Thermoleophilaceae bacterium]|jgi:LPPG:FO 2-phospho-L-lactate transferase|nr:2-phospho-L-lactate transferase [Thermoleophilaceae bacterium]
MIVVLAGGTGGAKLARGMLDVVGPAGLAVVVNTGDDSVMHGAHVSPDPDLVTYWLADLIDDRGWGIEGDTWNVMDALEAAGAPAWFRLGDRDLAMCLIRTALLDQGRRLTEAHAAVSSGLGVEAQVLPMADQPVRTRVQAAGEWLPLQEFLILKRDAEPEDLEFEGIGAARPTPEVLAAIAAAEAIVIGPSNPAISIGPILAVPGMQDALAASGAPVVAVSPFVAGRAIKGPTEAFCRQAGWALGAAGIAQAYDGVIHGVVSDEQDPVPGLPSLTVRTLMATADDRRGLAQQSLDFALSLRQ